MDVMIRTDADVVASGYFEDAVHRQRIVVDSIPPGLYEGDRLRDLWQKVYVAVDGGYANPFTLSIWDKIYRTELLRTYQMPVDERIFIGEDFAVTWPLLLHAKKVYETGRAYYHYCLRPDSMMVREKTAKEEAGLRALLDYLRASLFPMASSVPNIVQQYQCYELMVLYLRGAWNICEERWDNALLPFGDIPKKARIALYGAGQFGVQMKEYLDAHGYDTACWVDRAQSREGVECPSVLCTRDYDVLMLGVLKHEAVEGILENLHAIGRTKENVRRIDCRRLERKRR